RPASPRGGRVPGIPFRARDEGGAGTRRNPGPAQPGSGASGGWGAFGGCGGTSGAFWGRNCSGGIGIGTPGVAGPADAAASIGRGSGVNQGSLAMSLKAASVSGDVVTRQS